VRGAAQRPQAGASVSAPVPSPPVPVRSLGRAGAADTGARSAQVRGAAQRPQEAGLDPAGAAGPVSRVRGRGGAGAAVAGPEWRLPPEVWDRPRDGAYVASLAPVRAAVRAWMAAPEGSVLALRYPGGEAGLLWASELRDWLVALGVPPAAIALVPGAGGEALVLAVEGR